MKKSILAITILFTILCANPAVFADNGASSGNAGRETVIKAAEDPAAKAVFTDVSGHWAQDAVNRIVGKTMFHISDGKFQPDKPVARGEFATFLHEALGIRIMYLKATDIGEFFSDVKKEDSFAAALYDLAITGIVDDRGAFRPQDTLTREEMVHYIMNAYKHEMGEKFKQIKLSAEPFADSGSINIVYSGEVARAEHDGLIKRPANNKFYPKAPATRAQAVTTADRLLKRIGEEKADVSVVPSAGIKDGMVQMKLTITNHSDQKILIRHSSGQKFDFVLSVSGSPADAAKKFLYKWSADRMFTMALTQTAVEPGKSVEFTAEAGKDIYDAIQGKTVYLRGYITGTSEDFAINPDGYEARIQ